MVVRRWGARRPIRRTRWGAKAPVRSKWRRRRAAPVRMSRFPSTGINNSVMMKHKFVWSTEQADITTVPFTHFFRLNSMYDPDYSFIGHQPYYYDQMASLYDRYTVFGCKVVLRAATDKKNGIIGFKAQPDVTGIASAVQALERPMVKYAIINSGGPSTTLSSYYRMSSLFGVSRKTIADEQNYSALNTANPTNTYFVQVFAQAADSLTPLDVSITLELTYYARWNNRVRVAQS